jgi:hypothetical protein
LFFKGNKPEHTEGMEEPGIAMQSQTERRRAKRSQEEKGGTRRSQEEPEVARGSQEEARRARGSQEEGKVSGKASRKTEKALSRDVLVVYGNSCVGLPGVTGPKIRQGKTPWKEPCMGQ